MDFIGPLTQSQSGNDFIMVVVDSGSKRTIIEPCKSTFTAEDTANLFETTVWRHHGLPKVIISDRDPRFTSQFWQSLCKSLKITQNLSTTSHPQTDGQTEQKNDWIITALRHFVHHNQHDWDQYLHIIEFGINDTVNSSTGYTPFMLDTGRNPTSLLDISLTHRDPLDFRDMQARYKVAMDNLRTAQDKQAAIANRSRLADPFKVGDLVLISTQDFIPPNIRLRPSEKLSAKYSGPFTIEEKVGTSYRLAIPSDWHVHPVFHPEKLRPYYWDTSGPHPLSSQPIDTRTIEKILAHRTLENSRQVLVKWLNHSPIYNCWLPVDKSLQERIKSDLPNTPLESAILLSAPSPSSSALSRGV